MRKLNLLIAVASLLLANTAHAQFTGSIAVGASGLSNTPAYTYDSSSQLVNLTFASTGLFQGGSGTFASLASLSSVPTTNFEVDGLTVGQALTLSSPLTFDLTSTLIGAGTTPPNKYALEVTSLTVTSVSPTAGPIFTGTGFFIDNTNVLASSPATLVGGFSGSNNYSFSASVAAEAVPEPSSWALGLTVIGTLFYLRRRMLRA